MPKGHKVVKCQFCVTFSPLSLGKGLLIWFKESQMLYLGNRSYHYQVPWHHVRCQTSHLSFRARSTRWSLLGREAASSLLGSWTRRTQVGSRQWQSDYSDGICPRCLFLPGVCGQEKTKLYSVHSRYKRLMLKVKMRYATACKNTNANGPEFEPEISMIYRCVPAWLNLLIQNLVSEPATIYIQFNRARWK